MFKCFWTIFFIFSSMCYGRVEIVIMNNFSDMQRPVRLKSLYFFMDDVKAPTQSDRACVYYSSRIDIDEIPDFGRTISIQSTSRPEGWNELHGFLHFYYGRSTNIARNLHFSYKTENLARLPQKLYCTIRNAPSTKYGIELHFSKKN